MSMFGHMMIGEHYSENDEQLELEWREQCRQDRQQQEAMQLEQERQMLCEHALREALSKGISIANLKILCSECGISYATVCGEE